jgi:hypothetical protein
MGPFGRNGHTVQTSGPNPGNGQIRVAIDLCLIAKTNVLFAPKTEAPGSGEGSRALEQPSPRTAHGANVWPLENKIKET